MTHKVPPTRHIRLRYAECAGAMDGSQPLLGLEASTAAIGAVDIRRISPGRQNIIDSDFYDSRPDDVEHGQTDRIARAFTMLE